MERAAPATTDPDATEAPCCGARAVTDIPSGMVQLSHLVQAVQTRVAGHHDLTPVQARLLCL
ncbi:MAG TPA: hypothetical protein VNO31_53105, partial [Umezawaea sp.]|nr:hypothetical protein [Umezawaea sp.]